MRAWTGLDSVWMKRYWHGLRWVLSLVYTTFGICRYLGIGLCDGGSDMACTHWRLLKLIYSESSLYKDVPASPKSAHLPSCITTGSLQLVNMLPRSYTTQHKWERLRGHRCPCLDGLHLSSDGYELITFGRRRQDGRHHHVPLLATYYFHPHSLRYSTGQRDRRKAQSST